MQNRAASPHTVDADAGSAIPAQLAGGMGPANAFGRNAKGINAAKGFCFVSHTGEVFPSGFLPISAGSVHSSSLSTLYQDSQLFRELRDSSQLKGRCGRCEFQEICGGSRSRAYALTGDLFAEDPVCLYEPQGKT